MTKIQVRHFSNELVSIESSLRFFQILKLFHGMNHLYTFAIQLIDRYNGLQWRPAFWGLGWRCCQWWSLDYNTDRTPSHADILRQWLLIQIAVIPMQHAAFWFNQLKWLFFHNSGRITTNRFRIQTSFHWLGSMKGYSFRYVLGFYEWRR